MKVSLQWVAEKGLSDQVTFEQTPGGREGKAGSVSGGTAEGTASAKA